MPAFLLKIITTLILGGLFFAISIPAVLAQEDVTVLQETRNLVVPPDARIPVLNVPIPGLDLSSAVQLEKDSSNLRINLLGLYVDAIYTWLITAASIVAVIMMMVAGLQYATAAGNTSAVSAARDRLKNVVIGLLLILGANSIATFIDPNLTVFNPLSVISIEGIQLDRGTTGYEGSGQMRVSGTWEDLLPYYKEIVKSAKDGGKCYIPEGLASPTGYLPNQGQHHWQDGQPPANGDWTKISNLDWSNDWGSPILAPFDGTVTYAVQTAADNKCGNRIYLKSTTGNDKITICHVKDFLDENGQFKEIRPLVKQGDVIGHTGGLCCAGGGDVPSGWLTRCTAGGTQCVNPKTNGACSCQSISQSGNTTGPHVHITWSGSSNILACLQ